MEKKTVSKEEMENTIRKSFSMSQAESSSEQTVAEFRAKGMKNIQEQKQQETEHAIEQPTPSEHTRHTENMAVQRRISSKMRKKTLEAYK